MGVVQVDEFHRGADLAATFAAAREGIRRDLAGDGCDLANGSFGTLYDISRVVLRRAEPFTDMVALRAFVADDIRNLQKYGPAGAVALAQGGVVVGYQFYGHAPE